MCVGIKLQYAGYFLINTRSRFNVGFISRRSVCQPELNILYRGWAFTLYQHCKLVIKININNFGLLRYWNFMSEKCCEINLCGHRFTVNNNIDNNIHTGVDNVHWLCCA